MPDGDEKTTDYIGRGEVMFIAFSACIFLAIAGCVVYFVAKIVL